jgi:putative ABC transport system permease protein
MYRNYLITALRHLFRHKVYSFINIAGLSFGLASAMLILLFIRDELSYDPRYPRTLSASSCWRS